jgi:ADP-heptose:LPS heptosyltransferase
MGDVAMTVPVIKAALEQNPGLTVTVVSNAFFAPLFAGLERCHFHPAYLKTTHKGAAGMYRLFKELKKIKFDAVADLHHVLRSMLLRNFFKLTGSKIAVIDKGRQQKKALTRKENKILQPLASGFERYAAVLRQAGAAVNLFNKTAPYTKQQLPHSFVYPGKKIGIAPFAQHPEKMYPLQQMKVVAQQLAAQGHHILLFGAKGKEAATLALWESEIPGVSSMAGKYKFADELAIISNLDVMVSMDSANMHLASLYGIPVISIWGATHPFAGFYGWGQKEDYIVSVNLACRPCSVFGNKPCYRGDHACMQNISPIIIVEKTATLLNSSTSV